MPSKHGKKRIIDNLEVYSDKILDIISSTSREGCAELIAAMEAAYARYKGTGVASWFYLYSRTRGSDIQIALGSMEAFPDVYTRLQEFQLLVGRGEWNHGSFNYYLIDELTQIIPGYKPLKSEEAGAVTQRLGVLIYQKIDLLMKKYKQNTLGSASQDATRSASSEQLKPKTEHYSGLTLFNQNSSNQQCKAEDRCVLNL